MKKLEVTQLVRQALTTPQYKSTFPGRTPSHHKKLIMPGSEILRQELIHYVEKELKLKFPLSIVNKTMAHENLAIVFQNIRDKHSFPFFGAPSHLMLTNEHRTVLKANALKALAFAVHAEQREFFTQILEEIKKSVSVTGDAFYKMKLVVDETGGGYIDDYITCESNEANKAKFKAVITYQDQTAEAIGNSKRIAVARACEKWLIRRSIPF